MPDKKNWLNFIDNPNGISSSSHLPSIPQDDPLFPPKVPSSSESAFSAKEFLLPSWKGEDLRPLTLVKLSNLLPELHQQAYGDLKKQNFSRHNRQQIIDDLTQFCQNSDLIFPQGVDSTLLWEMLWQQDNPYRESFDLFLQDFIHKTVVLALLKIYTVYHLLSANSESVRDQALVNAHNSLTTTFPKQGPWSLSFEVLKLNQFTWFKLDAQMIRTLALEKNAFWAMPEVEWCKLLGPEFQHSRLVNGTSSFEFIQTLAQDFTTWAKKNSKSGPFFSSASKLPISHLYAGDHLPVFMTSHWSSLQNIQDIQHQPLVDFDFTTQGPGYFYRLVHELLQISSLSKVAKKNAIKPTDLIIHKFKEKELRLRQQGNLQTSLLQNTSTGQKEACELLVLNLQEFPKANAHFHLLTQISKFKDSLVQGGWLIVLGQKKLFVPSQSEKVNALLQTLRLEAAFGLDTLKGRGDLAPFIYIFTKRSQSELGLPWNNIAAHNNMEKQSCLSFRFAGDLACAGRLDGLTQELRDFFKKRSPDVATLYQTEISGNLTFEFFLDAIVDGKLINSTSKDQNKITHPHFFKGLWKTSLPLDDCFQLEVIEADDEHTPTNWYGAKDLLGLTSQPEDKFEYVIILDQRMANQTRLEVIPASSLPAKKQEYGMALCHYFGALPKYRGLNLNILRAYFEGPIGKQLVALALTGNASKLKGRLRSLLIPKFFTEMKELPPVVSDILGTLYLSKDDIKKSDVPQLSARLQKVFQSLEKYWNEFPLAVLSSLCQLQFQLSEAFREMSSSSSGSTHFYCNPMVIQGMQKFKNYPIYPKHPDLFIEFKGQGVESLNLLFAHSKIEMTDKGLPQLTLFSDFGPVLHLHGPSELLSFCHYILKAAEGHSCLAILQGLRAPISSDLKEILNFHSHLGNEVNELLEKVNATINTIMRSQLQCNV